MSRYGHTAIFQGTYLLTLSVYKATSNFKKEYKYTLGEKLKLVSHELLDLIVLANSQKDKIYTLKQLDNKLETMRIYLRIAFDLKIISAGLFEDFNKKIEEIGKQIGGWQKWANK